MMTNELQKIPSVNILLREPAVEDLCKKISRPFVLETVRSVLSNIRSNMRNGEMIPGISQIISDIKSTIDIQVNSFPKPIINATGIILHTNFGRALLSKEATNAVKNIATNYSNLEFDLVSGQRYQRHKHIEHIINYLTDSEASNVVNNNASALILTLTSICEGREIIISKGEQVEIGGGFRIPDIINQSKVHIKEVGTTNRTYLSDYENAINENTAAILKVHPSNFKTIGFTESPELDELVTLANKYDIKVINDLGSGCLINTEKYGIEHEPTVQESVSSGSHITLFSGDKLIGGPQSGIIIGEQGLIEKTIKHPLARSFRLDKLNLAALHITLEHYVKDEVEKKIPVWKMIKMSKRIILTKAKKLQKLIKYKTTIEKGLSQIGGGSLPGQELETYVLAIDEKNMPLDQEIFKKILRESTPAIIGRSENSKLLLDLRTILPNQIKSLASTINNIKT
jgi:L-seryl-tRNA(Ser) seleniumtransferase